MKTRCAIAALALLACADGQTPAAPPPGAGRNGGSKNGKDSSQSGSGKAKVLVGQTEMSGSRRNRRR